MSNYIIFDLEWNQSAAGKETSLDHLPFEIFEIGAVKLNEKMEQVSQFHPAGPPLRVPAAALYHFRGDPCFHGRAGQGRKAL